MYIAISTFDLQEESFWLLDPVFFCIVDLKKMYHLTDIITFVENKITAHLNLILLIEAGRQTLSTVWLLSVWRCLTVSMTLHWYQYHLECTLVSIMTNAEDQLIRIYGTSFIKCTQCCINILFITTLELCLSIQI